MSPKRPAARLALAVACCGLAGGLAAHLSAPDAVAQDGQQQGNGQGIGVVDFTRIQNDSTFVQAIQERLRNQTQQAQQDLQNQANELRQAQQDLQNLAEGVPARLEKEREIAEKNAVLQFRQQAAQQEAAVALNQANLEFYDAAEKAIAEVARDRGLAVVIRSNTGDIPDDRARLSRIPPDDLRGLIQGQTALYVDPSADITGEVVSKIDADNGQPNNNGN